MQLLSILIALLTGAHPSWQSLKPTNFSNNNLFPSKNFNTKLITIFFYFREALVRAVIIHGFPIISKYIMIRKCLYIMQRYQKIS